MLNKIKNSKRGQVFAYLDIISIMVLVIIIIALLIYINISNTKEQKKIELLTEGVNLPHYVMNIFQSEIIDMPSCYLKKTNATRIDALVWLNYVKSASADKDYKECVKDFSNSLTRFENEGLGKVGIIFDFILGDQTLLNYDNSNIKDIYGTRLFVREWSKKPPSSYLNTYILKVNDNSYLKYDFNNRDIGQDDILTAIANSFGNLDKKLKFFELTMPARTHGKSGAEEIKILVFYKAIEEK